MSIPYCFDYSSFVILFKIGTCDSSSLVLLSQNCFGYLGSSVIHTNFRIVFSTSVKNVIGTVIRIAINLYIALNSTFWTF